MVKPDLQCKASALSISELIADPELENMMLKRKKPALKRRRLLDISSSRRRIKRAIALKKIHLRRRAYLLLPDCPEAL